MPNRVCLLFYINLTRKAAQIDSFQRLTTIKSISIQRKPVWWDIQWIKMGKWSRGNLVLFGRVDNDENRKQNLYHKNYVIYSDADISVHCPKISKQMCFVHFVVAMSFLKFDTPQRKPLKQTNWSQLERRKELQNQRSFLRLTERKYARTNRFNEKWKFD